MTFIFFEPWVPARSYWGGCPFTDAFQGASWAGDSVEGFWQPGWTHRINAETQGTFGRRSLVFVHQQTGNSLTDYSICPGTRCLVVSILLEAMVQSLS